ncbi:MAG: hypothetical protein E7520_04290 [Ruminococcaceae bacterium]|nr:hypothetical protein [Oscillospiraceae bacterium]
MWLSKRITREAADSRAQKGNITISGAERIEAMSSANAQRLGTYTPYGYTSSAPIGEEVIVLPSSDGEIALGTRCKAEQLDSGEVMISSLGGAKILLRNNGDVVINALVIDKNGVIHND